MDDEKLREYDGWYYNKCTRKDILMDTVWILWFERYE